MHDSVVHQDEKYDCSRIRYERTKFMIKRHFDRDKGGTQSRILKKKGPKDRFQSASSKTLRTSALPLHMRRRSNIMKSILTRK